MNFIFKFSSLILTKKNQSQKHSTVNSDKSYLNQCYYRQDAAKRQTAGIVFTHRPKIRFFAPQGRLVAPIRVKLCSTDGHLGPLGCAKFHVYRCRGVGMRPPKCEKFPIFVKESPRRGDSLDRFR